ncbi:MAG: LysM domain-containing protein [bacterium]
MAQDIELKFDDDKDESSQKLSVESDTNQDIAKSVNPDIKNDQQIKVGISETEVKKDTPTQKNSISPEINSQNSTVEISDDTAYKTGVLAIGVPVLLFMIIMGVSTHKPREKKESNKSEIKNEEVIVETDEADYTPNNKQLDSSITNEQGSGFADGELYTVKPGETLYEIGLELDLDWKVIAEINGIEPPYDLRSGQELELPK